MTKCSRFPISQIYTYFCSVDILNLYLIRQSFDYKCKLCFLTDNFDSLHLMMIDHSPMNLMNKIKMIDYFPFYEKDKL